MSADLTKLNENQRKAVRWDDGPLLVLAGPGSGKTRVLTFRIARLLDEYEHTSVLALTFSSRAAAEMSCLLLTSPDFSFATRMGCSLSGGVLRISSTRASYGPSFRESGPRSANAVENPWFPATVVPSPATSMPRPTSVRRLRRETANMVYSSKRKESEVSARKCISDRSRTDMRYTNL